MSNEEFKVLIDSILKDNPTLTQDGIMVALGYGEGYISQVLSRAKSTGIVSDKLANRIKEKFVKSNVSKEIVVKESPIKETEYSLQAIKNLTEANRQMAESNNKLADGHLRLIALLEGGKEIEPSQSVVLRLLARSLAGEKYNSVEEAEAAIRKAFRTEFSKQTEEKKKVSKL